MNSKQIIKIALQFCVLVIFYILGNGISFLSGGYIPGSVIGMLLLFVSLNLGWIKPSNVDKVSELLLGNIVLFFLPVTVGLMTVVALLQENLGTILVAVVVSTISVLITVGIVAQKLEHNTTIRAWQRKIFRSIFFLKKTDSN